MHHNLTLNDLAADTVMAALIDISASVTEARRLIMSQVDAMSASEFDARYAELRAYLGTIMDAQYRVAQIVFHTARDDSDYGIDTSRHPSSGRLPAPTSPHGLERPNLARVRHLSCDDDCSCRGGK